MPCKIIKTKVQFVGSCLLALLLIFSCDLPKDPHSSWAESKNGVLRAGIIDNPPFCYRDHDTAAGSEVKLLKQFAEREQLKVTFVFNNETGLIKDLEEYKVQVGLGGFAKNTVWKRKVGMTTTYNGKNVMFVPKGENELLMHLENYLLTLTP